MNINATNGDVVGSDKFDDLSPNDGTNLVWDRNYQNLYFTATKSGNDQGTLSPCSLIAFS